MAAAHWSSLAQGEPITNPSLISEGFIHCTDEPSVLLQVANAFYAAQQGDFVVVSVDTDALTSQCVWEAPALINDSAPAFAPTFPHIFGPINRDAVVGVRRVTRAADGRFIGYTSVPE